MGRKSRDKRARAQASPSEVSDRDRRRIARRAERRGLHVPPTLERYRALGTERFGNAVISRANQRWANMGAAEHTLAPMTMNAIAPLVGIDKALVGNTEIITTSPSDPQGDWASHIRWGADSGATAARLLLLGQTAGAVVVARQQLERWSTNLAYSRGLQQGKSEPKAEFIERAWDGYGSPPADPGRLYEQCSEMLHGRGSMLATVTWGTADLLVPAEPGPEVEAGLESVANVIGIPLLQVAGCATSLVEDAGQKHPSRAAIQGWSTYDSFEYSPDMDRLWRTMVPLTPDNLDPTTRAIASYASLNAALTDGAPSEAQRAAVMLAFLTRRIRAAETARRALKAEEQVLGADYNPDSISGSEALMVIVSEMATLLGVWTDSPEAEDWCLAASSLRSGFFLWLEDDDRALGLVRVLIETTARLRTRRMKPRKAEDLESRGSRTTPRDWIEAAGWRRLSNWSKALGEFAHFRPGTRWSGAKTALAAAIAPGVEGNPFLRIRGQTLYKATVLLASECIERLEELDADVRNTYAQLVRGYTGASLGEGIEDWLDHVWDHRVADFGPPDFVGPAMERPS